MKILISAIWFALWIILAGAAYKALGQVPPPPAASQADVNAGILRSKYVSPATLIGATTKGTTPFATSWMTNQFLEWWSADYGITNTAGSVVTNWAGLNGSLLQGNAWFYPQGMANGHPGVYFDGTGNNILTNINFLGQSCTSACTMFIVYRVPQSAAANAGTAGGNQALVDGMTQNGVERAFFTADTPLISGSAAGQALPGWYNWFASSGTAGYDGADYTWGDDTHVFAITWTFGSLLQDYIDGKMSQNSVAGVGDGSLGGTPQIGFSGTLCLGQLYNIFWPANAYISELLIYTNSLPNLTIDRINNYFLTKYGLNRMVIDQFGDSMAWGGNSACFTFPAAWNSILASNFPNATIENSGLPAATSTQVLSNIVQIAGTSCGTTKVGMIWCNGQNGPETIGTITNNLIKMSQILRTNGWLTILVDPPSNGFTDTNTGGTFKGSYQNFATNCWPQYFNAIIDLARDNLIGYSNAWTNVVYYPVAGYVGGVGAHWTNTTYTLTAPYVISAVNYALNPSWNNFTGSTNQQPPWGFNWSLGSSVPWELTYQGHFYTSLGSNTWVLVK